ncbi:metallophosphoesterase family protein [Stakelama tenebrarum]|uniref:metallophosphoesterase family protein n=1 Tax=Stakelama tenebrarum TaxID=2711215 RepID=UPI001D190DA9|nr:metallophosphoesterase family protein [Sphingosinithalassobacter tenebrarum]
MARSPSKRKGGKARATAAGERIYAIGDIHGRYDLLRDLLRRIEQHSRGLPEPEALHVVLLGDVIDRGPNSAEVLDFLWDWSENTTGQIMLMGNHEEMLLRVLDGELRLLRPWMHVGGKETVESFGLEEFHRRDNPEKFIAALREAIPSKIVEWLRKWPLCAQSGDYYFCHAGVRPKVPLNRQKRNDLMWIRDEFLNYEGDHGAVVVHGHSISPGVDIRSNRVGIDTGAYQTGVLTALYVEDEARDTVATDPDQPSEPENEAADTEGQLAGSLFGSQPLLGRNT